MKIKGTAVKSIPDFVQSRYPDQYKNWFTQLPPDSQKLFRDGISTANWYDMNHAATIPTQKVGEVIFKDIKKGAWESGRYSAEVALNGIYKLYVKFASPEHIIERAGRVFSAYYEGSDMRVLNSSKKNVEVAIMQLTNIHEVIEYRIGGWMEKALEITGCKDLKIEIKSSLSKGADKTLYVITWN